MQFYYLNTQMGYNYYMGNLLEMRYTVGDTKSVVRTMGYLV